MTVANQTSRADFTGNGVTTAFAFPFVVFATSEVTVYLDGALQATGYSVVLTPPTREGGSSAGGTVIFGTAPPAGVKVALVRAVPYTQGVQYPAGGDKFPSVSHENGLDRAVILAQQLVEALSRAPKFGTASLHKDLVLPELAGQAGRVLGVNGDETSLTYLNEFAAAGTNPMTTAGDLIVGGVAGVPARLAAGAECQRLGVGTGGLGWRNHDVVDVLADLGLPIDGIGSATAAIQAGIAKAIARGGGTVLVRRNLNGTPYLLTQVGVNPYQAGHRYCLDIPGDHVRLVLEEGVVLKLANGQQVDATGPVDLIVARARSRITITGGGRITGNTAGQPGWTGGYAQTANGNLLRFYHDSGSLGMRDLLVEGLQLDDHWSNPVDFQQSPTARHRRLRLRDLYGFDCGEGFQVFGADDVWLENLIYEDLANVAVGDGIELSDVTRFSVRGCRVRSNGTGTAFDLFGCRDGVLEDFVVDGWEAGLDVNTDSLGHVPTDLVIANGLIKNCPTYSVAFKGAAFTRVTARTVVISGGGNQGFQVAADNLKAVGPLTLEDCEAHGCTGSGLIIKTIAKLTVRGGRYSGNTADGISWTGQEFAAVPADTAELHITGVTATGNGGWGLSLNGQGLTGKEPTGAITDCCLIGNTSGGFQATDQTAKTLLIAGLAPDTRSGPSTLVAGIRIYTPSANLATLGNPSQDQTLRLRFTGAITITDKTQAGGVNINLAGAVNFVATDKDFLVLHYVSAVGEWFEQSRSVL